MSKFTTTITPKQDGTIDVSVEYDNESNVMHILNAIEVTHEFLSNKLKEYAKSDAQKAAFTIKDILAADATVEA